MSKQNIIGDEDFERRCLTIVMQIGLEPHVPPKPSSAMQLDKNAHTIAVMRRLDWIDQFVQLQQELGWAAGSWVYINEFRAWQSLNEQRLSADHTGV